MPSPFAVLFTAAAADLDGLYGQSFTLTPLSKPDGRGRPVLDPGRAATTLVGIFAEPSSQDFPSSRGHASTASQMVGGSKPTVTYTTASLPYRAAIGDLVSKADGTGTYVVSDPGDDGLARTTLKLTAKA